MMENHTPVGSGRFRDHSQHPTGVLGMSFSYSPSLCAWLSFVSLASFRILDTTLILIGGRIRSASISRGQLSRVVDRYHIRIAHIVAPFGMSVCILDECVKATIASIAIVSFGN